MMKKICIFVLVLVSAATFVTAGGITENGAGTAQYDVIAVENPTLNVDGKLDETCWTDIPEISGSFNYPWEAIQTPKTVFKGFHDGTYFYFSFVVEDKEVLVEDGWNADESTVDVEDRVEIFFAGGSVDQPDDYKLAPYYSFEVDAKGRVHDYSAVYYRHLDSTWNLKGLKAAGVITESGYIVEGAVPIASLKDLNLLRKDSTIRAGIFRAEFSTAGSEIKMQWISWVDPNTTYPDFHVDSAFGVFRFLDL